MSFLFPDLKPIELSPREQKEKSWLQQYQANDVQQGTYRETLGDLDVRRYYEAIRDELRQRGALASVDPQIGAIYIVDANREKPGYVVWSVGPSQRGVQWAGSLYDARQINLQGTGTRPGSAGALQRIGPPPTGWWDRLSRGRQYEKQLDSWAHVYGPNGTGIEVLDYPDKMFGTITSNFTHVDVYDVGAVAQEMMRAMQASGITFSGNSNLTREDRAGQDVEQTPVQITDELRARWRALGRDGGSWRYRAIGGTTYRMPEPPAPAPPLTRDLGFA